MLTRSHYAARHYVCAHDRPTYRRHMCGLCHALGDDYGLTTRLLTNHDMILLNLLTEAQYPQETPTVMRRCPLNPRRKVPAKQETASRFAAATAVTLAAVSVEDDLQDSHGRDLTAQVARRWLRGHRRAALEKLTELDFDVAPLERLADQQATAERDAGAVLLGAALAKTGDIGAGGRCPVQTGLRRTAPQGASGLRQRPGEIPVVEGHVRVYSRL